MRHRAQFDLTSLREIVEQEIRKALLTVEALAVLPGVGEMIHALKNHCRKITPRLPESSSFSIPFIYTMNYDNKDRLLLHDSQDAEVQGTEAELAYINGGVTIYQLMASALVLERRLLSSFSEFGLDLLENERDDLSDLFLHLKN
ncbi:unnamed protein product [Rotaria sp. Silwood2]|nr:unnamed protein product [Rotaria sp. Silwood2]CAF4527391.1 unnamed protein product [Rotaria sp. Silwood2]